MGKSSIKLVNIPWISPRSQLISPPHSPQCWQQTVKRYINIVFQFTGAFLMLKNPHQECFGTSFDAKKNHPVFPWYFHHAFLGSSHTFDASTSFGILDFGWLFPPFSSPHFRGCPKNGDAPFSHPIAGYVFFFQCQWFESETDENWAQ